VRVAKSVVLQAFRDVARVVRARVTRAQGQLRVRRHLSTREGKAPEIHHFCEVIVYRRQRRASCSRVVRSMHDRTPSAMGNSA
jgi:hypothetical protein